MFELSGVAMSVSTILLFLSVCLSGFLQEGPSVDVFFGTGNNNLNAPAGVYRAILNEDSGDLERPSLVFELDGAGWVTTHPQSKVIYATGTLKGKPSVVALDVQNPGDTNLLSVQPIEGGGGSCFLTTDQTATVLISAQYGGGSIAVFPLGNDGTIGERSQLIEHVGGSRTVPGRQDSPHPHYVAISPDNRFAFVPDLGLDQLIAYRIDLAEKKLVPHGKIDVVAGGGPRHMKFHPSGKYAFVLNELSLAVTVFQYDTESGAMQRLTTVAALTDEEKLENSFNSASEIRVHRNGKFLYSANRGHDSISIFRFNEGNAELTRIQNVPIRGSWPRNFNISPDGHFLLAAGRDSNSISMFHLNSDTGDLRYIQQGSEFVPAPICVTFDGR
jgi:6-phosphogluconolactonase